MLNLPGRKDVWKINRVTEIRQKENKDVEVTVVYQEYGNIRHDFKKGEQERTITVKRKWSCFNELMDYFSDLCR